MNSKDVPKVSAYSEMMGLFRKRKIANDAPPRAIPDGRRVYAIGDIHGRLDLLDDLIDRIEADDAARPGAETEWIFLGDLIDRGPDSAGVVDRLCTLAGERPGLRFILGNHEEVFLRALDGEIEALRMFVRIGGRETILSYGVEERAFDHTDYPELLALMRAHVPQRHVDFLNSFEDRIEIGDYVFVHAGIRPGVAIADQRVADMRWIRASFLNHAGEFGKLIVHGHSISEEADIRDNRIGIDTGAYHSGLLTALGLEENKRWFIATERDALSLKACG